MFIFEVFKLEKMLIDFLLSILFIIWQPLPNTVVRFSLTVEQIKLVTYIFLELKTPKLNSWVEFSTVHLIILFVNNEFSKYSATKLWVSEEPLLFKFLLLFSIV